MQSTERKTHIINGEGKTLGRLATQIATLLRGKHKVAFVPYDDRGDFVTVYNTDKLHVSGKKMEQKTYWRHTGYIGHVRFTPLEKLFYEDSRKVLYRAVGRMLPSNKLRKGILKRLKMYRGPIQP